MTWRTAPLRRSTPLRARNPKRAAKRLAENFGPQAKLCRRLPCCVCEHTSEKQIGESVPHHDPTRAAGGTDRDTMPMCTPHHAQVHVQGRTTFWARVGINPRTVIESMRRRVAEAATEIEDGGPTT